MAHIPVVNRLGLSADSAPPQSPEVAERKSREPVFHSGKQEYRILFDFSPVAMAQADANGKFIRVNRKMCDLTGYSEEELLCRSIQDITHPEDRDSNRAAFQQMMSGKKETSYPEKRYIRKDGAVVWVRVTACAIQEDSGVVCRSLGIIEDITEHKKADDALRASERRFRRLFESLPVSALLIDPQNRRFLLFNDAAAKNLGYTREEFARLGIPDVEATHDGAKIDEIHARLMSGGPVQFETQHRCKSGELRDVLVNGHTIEIAGRTVVLGIWLDITQRKRVEEALIRTEKLASVGRMAATIAHEINNPLAAVMNTLYLAKTHANCTDTVREFLDIADAELARISHITRQALGFYRETSTPVKVSVSAILNSVVDLLKSKIKAKHATIVKEWNTEWEITAIAGELRQVFSNLVANSLDAIAEYGTIKLRVSSCRCTKHGQRIVRVTVADDGKGIDSTALPHIFEPFFTTKDSFGTGLGLWVSKQIVEKHGGLIRVRSSSHGRHCGTVFSVVLPFEAAPAKARTQAAISAQ